MISKKVNKIQALLMTQTIFGEATMETGAMSSTMEEHRHTNGQIICDGHNISDRAIPSVTESMRGMFYLEPVKSFLSLKEWSILKVKII